MSFCIDISGERADDERIGGKARSLARLAGAGLPVPRAFAISSEVFRAMRASIQADEILAAALPGPAALAEAPWPPSFEDELAAALARLAPGPDARFSVRSSAALEDRGDALGAGLFLSRVDVPSREVAAAAREVMGAALEPAPLAYAARRGLPPAELAMAVLVHPYTRGDASGTAAFDPAVEEAPLVERTRGGALSPAACARLVAATRDVAARTGAAELEWVAEGDVVLFLQQRPYRASKPRPWTHAAALADGTWSWDAAHNPLPLSPAQAGLVALVDERCRTAFRQRVVGGYLFWAPSPRATPPRVSAPEALRALTREVEARLGSVRAEASLEAALELFVSAYEPLYGVVQPAARAAREALAAFLAPRGRAGELAELLRAVPSLATERGRRAAAIAASADPDERAAAVAAYLALFGDEAPVWDVATPTFAEDPSLLLRLGGTAISTSADAPPTTDLPADGAPLLAAAREAAAVAEDDDVLYARVQARVRHAILREGERLHDANLLARPEDVFWLPLELVRRSARGEEALTLATVTHAIAEARAAHAAALADPPPLPAAPQTREGGVRGRRGSSGRATGRVHLHDPATPVPPGCVLVARTLLPTELPLVSPAAIVVETGGVLGHVAAQARERNLPALVDAPGATTAFRSGDLVLLDADLGVAIRIMD
jgi:phosphohistidine swiveling domain-containing protein